MAQSQPTLSATEPTVFAAIKTLEQNIHTYLDSCPLGAAAEVIGNWINGLDTYLFQIFQLNAPAQWLNSQGLPNTSHYLTAMTRDFASAQQKYVELYQNMVATQSRWQGIWSEANAVALDNINEAIQYRNAVFGNWMKDYFAITENRCFRCGRMIGIPGGGYCLDCARILGLIY